VGQDAALSFGLRNDAYNTFRINYPAALYTEIERAAPTVRRNLAVDLGSGTGLSIPPLLQRFDKVIAVEPDARMTEKITPHLKLRVCNVRSEEFDIESHTVDLITCATAFYWMDGPLLLERMARWLHTDGLIAVYRYCFPVAPDAINHIIQRELQQRWDDFRSPRLIDEEYNQYSWKCFGGCNALRNVNSHAIPNSIAMNSHSLVGFFSSTSYCGAYLRSIKNPDAYLSSLETEIAAVANNQSFEVDFAIELITATI